MVHVLLWLYFLNSLYCLELFFWHISLYLHLVLLYLLVSKSWWNYIIMRILIILIVLINFRILNCWHLNIIIDISLRCQYCLLSIKRFKWILKSERSNLNKIVLEFLFRSFLQEEFITIQDIFISTFRSH
jgi:hypothetical protein